MASPRTSTDNRRAFTLIEVLVVMGMLAIVGGFGLIVSMDSFRNYSLKDERDLIVSALQQARNQSINNMCFSASGVSCADGKPHGVKILPGQYVVFQGPDYIDRDAAVDQVYKSVYAAASVTGFTEAVFLPLSGNASTSPAGLWSVTVADSAGSANSIITLGDQGQIRWTH